mmetsp:Transcript_92672/g.164768  ORF Transcript_92672/g.164768 Transcript_92672/m.164768 type:complete len:413 (-) Transcript_92672:63-1301(-)
MEQSVEDLRAVLLFLADELSESDVHLAGHGFGGSLLMEALLHHGIYEVASELPRLHSVVLLCTPSSMAVAEEEAHRLMKEAQQDVGSQDAPHSFWCRHVCAVFPQPTCLRDAYRQAGDRTSGWWCTGALQGWSPCLHDACESDWELRETSPLGAWQISEEEMHGFKRMVGAIPLLSMRGEYDFITEECVKTWRAVDGVRYSEEVVVGAGHHLHLDSPRVSAEKICSWLRREEEENEEDEMELHAYSLECQLLGNAETRSKLSNWASLSARATPEQQEAWTFHWRTAYRKVEDKYWSSPVPCQEARRLAAWARGLPEAVVHTSGSLLQEVLSSEARDSPRQAIGVRRSDQLSLEAIVCLERLDHDAQADGHDALLIVGAAASPDADDSLRDAAVRHVADLVTKSGMQPTFLYS